MRIYPRSDWPFRIVEEPPVTDAIVAARAKYSRFDEAWDGLIWLIAHGGDAMIAEEREQGTVVTYEGDGVAGFPRIVLVYRWGMGRYTIRYAVISDPPED